jgi:hypothetical protein
MKLALLALASVLAASPAAAAVTYTFGAISSFTSNWTGNWDEQITGGFSVTVASPISTNTAIPAASLTSCGMSGSISGFIPCGDQEFRFDTVPGYLIISFSGPNFGIFYYFDPAASTTNGTWDTTIFGTDQQGILVTSGAPTSVVPEPASWAMLIAGFGLTGAAMRRRRSSAVAT